MDTNLPKTPFQNLAVSLSGGGYRAASFHLGLLTYLSSVHWSGTTLLERVRIISTVSGGTFTGVSYATTIAEGNTMKECYNKMYRFMSEVDLIGDGLRKLADYDNWNTLKSRSLINALSLVYYDKLERSTFSDLFNNNSHLKEIIFNSTEFTYGLPFRFQKTMLEDREFNFVYLGNRQVNMPLEAEKELRLADIISASSCFPMGFEPINFPEDFRHEQSKVLNNLKESYQKDQWGRKCKLPVGLMDGGIVDNQGIDSVIWAEKRMKAYKGELRQFASEDEKAIDLYIISDVASPYMDSYVRTEEKAFKKWRKWSFKKFTGVGLILLVVGLLTIYLASILHKPTGTFITGFFAAIFFLFSGLSFFLSDIFEWSLKKFNTPDFFMKKLHAVSSMKFGVYETLIKNRISSVQSMVSEVFMKQIRRQEYSRVYNDKSWKGRCIMNAIYELTNDQTKYRNAEEKDLISEDLKNISHILIEISEKAKSMGTTLWFTSEELEDDFKRNRSLLNSLIACGQFTGCYNLLEYIEKILWNRENKEGYDNYPLTLKSEIKDLYNELLSHWHKFNDNPYWMLDEFNRSIGI